MTHSDTLSVLGEVEEERQKQDAKWGQQNHASTVWLTVLTEEVGELAEVVLEHRVAVAIPAQALGVWRCRPIDGDPREFFREQMRKEAIQCAAVSVAIVEWIDRGCPIDSSDLGEVAA